MSKRRFFGTRIDQAFSQVNGRRPEFRVYLWNPNRTSIHEVVLDQARSPRYDITDWVMSIDLQENIVFENNDNAIASTATLNLVYEPYARPIEITERTLIDGAPVRIVSGDASVPEAEWVPVFTGVCRGVPSIDKHTRDANKPPMMIATIVDRAEKYITKTVTARSYEQGEDIGKAIVETAIEWMYLDRREIRIGHQGYDVGHPQSQLVDIEVLKGIADILFVVGKKPRFDSEGFLVAADTDLDRTPAREHPNRDGVISIRRQQMLSSVYNSVRLLGLDNNLTEVVEREKRLAHGSITAGYFETNVSETIYFSENDGKPGGGRRAKNTRLKNVKVSTVGGLFGENLTWTPTLEDDGYTTFGGVLSFDTGFDIAIRSFIVATWAAATIAQALATHQAIAHASAGDIASANTAATMADIAAGTATAAMIAFALSVTEMGRVYWEIHGNPFQNVYQQLSTVAALNGVLTEDIRERELRNDWFYSISTMRERAKQLLRRELIKGWSFEIAMLDDPLVDVDDLIKIGDEVYYITSIQRTLSRPPNGIMTLSAWRIA